jgi:hypothetical protein
MDIYSIVIIVGILIISLVLFLVNRQSKEDKGHSSETHIKRGTPHAHDF